MWQNHNNKTNKVLAQNIHIVQLNKFEEPNIGKGNYTHLIFDNDTKNISWKKWKHLQQICSENWTSTHRKVKLDLYLSPCTKTSFQWIKELNMKPKSFKLLEESVGSAPHDIGIRKFCTGHHLSRIKAKNWQMGLIETKKSMYSKRNNQWCEEEANKWETISTT